MANPVKKLRDKAKRKSVQRSIMGKDAAWQQDHEQLQAEQKGGGAAGRAAVKRVGEYKRAKAQKVANKMAHGGLCRGGGAAIRGMRYGKDG